VRGMSAGSSGRASSGGDGDGCEDILIVSCNSNDQINFVYTIVLEMSCKSA